MKRGVVLAGAVFSFLCAWVVTACGSTAKEAIDAGSGSDDAGDVAVDGVAPAPPWCPAAPDDAIELLDASYGAGSSLTPDGGAPLPGPPPTQCSQFGIVPINYMFTNNAACTLDLYWVDYTCEEVFYTGIPAGKSVNGQTFETHPWRLRAAGSKVLVKDIMPQPEVVGVDAGTWLVAYP